MTQEKNIEKLKIYIDKIQKNDTTIERLAMNIQKYIDKMIQHNRTTKKIQHAKARLEYLKKTYPEELI